MSYALTLGQIHILSEEAENSLTEECGCDDARSGCRPAYVFSVAGQVQFRTALKHLS